MIHCSKCGGIMLSNYGEIKCVNCGYERVEKVRFSPMLAKLTQSAFDSKEHIFEQKFDGIRCIAYINEDTKLVNRSQVDVTDRFPEIYVETKIPCTLDGELICSNFQAMQTRANRKLDIANAARSNPAKYVVFDILEHDNVILMETPLIERKAILDEVVIPTSTTSVIPFVHETGIEYFEQAEQSGWEGLIAKKLSSRYYPGRRTDAWLKIKVQKQLICDIVGATVGLGKRSNTFGALVVAYENQIVAEVGTGYTDEELDDIDTLLSITTKSYPQRGWKYEVGLGLFKCKVKFAERTEDGNLRFPVFEGLV